MSLRIRYETVEFGAVDIHLRTLRDNQEFEDDDGEAADLGISSATWPRFGVVWDAGRALAQLMFAQEVDGLRILEVGCGIGLASLVLNHRKADITATDYHPEAGAFLAANVALNGGEAIRFVRTGWIDADDAGLGQFDLIIGSDVLYERGHADVLSAFIDQHARPACTVIIVDPGRGERVRFSRCMAALGYTASRRRFQDDAAMEGSFKGDILQFVRGAAHP